MLGIGKKTTINTDKVDTLIGKNTKFEGNLSTEGTIRIDGEVIGDVILSGNLILGEQGRIKGNVKSDNIHLSGIIEGNVMSANQIHISASGKLYGDMSVKNIIIDEGGLFQGNSNMIGEEKQD